MGALYGKTYFGNERTSFVIDPEGAVKAVLRKVRPTEHDELVLAAPAEYRRAAWSAARQRADRGPEQVSRP